ncbi:succinate dehydrogenase assembly factor 2 [Chytridiales sp. JEL 0842]|nr:succinate dehydrogenase assembly factor 2 [Chytridiales sp. JEL 0842]
MNTLCKVRISSAAASQPFARCPTITTLCRLPSPSQSPRPFSTSTRLLSSSNNNNNNSSKGSQYPDEWARKPPPSADPTSEESIEFTIPIPKPVRPANESIETKRARLVWMSRKRGILETDLLLSTFAKVYLGKMDMQALDEYDALLEENDWDIYYWATGARQPPPEVKGMKFWEDLVEHSKNKGKDILRMPELQ